MQARLNTICQRVLRKTLDPDDDLFVAGLNVNRALNIVRLFFLDSGIELDVNIFFRYRTIAAIAAAIEEECHEPEGKALLLRPGKGPPLFVYAGGVGVFLEVNEVVQALAFEGPVYGLRLTDFRRGPDAPAGVADEARDAVATIRALQPEGPYRLLGYSFGGILVLEVARLLRADGDAVALCGMIDAPQSDHVWPIHLWAGLMARRALHKTLALRGSSKAERLSAAAAEVATAPPERLAMLSGPAKGKQLFFRFRNPRHPDYPYFAPQWIAGNTPDYARRATDLLRMKGLYRPCRHEGQVLFLLSSQGSPVDCDARMIWTPYLPRAEWVVMKGNHLSMLVGRNGRLLAAEISTRLQASAATAGR